MKKDSKPSTLLPGLGAPLKPPAKPLSFGTANPSEAGLNAKPPRIGKPLNVHVPSSQEIQAFWATPSSKRLLHFVIGEGAADEGKLFVENVSSGISKGATSVLAPLKYENLMECWWLLTQPLASHHGLSLDLLAEALTDPELDKLLFSLHRIRRDDGDYLAFDWPFFCLWLELALAIKERPFSLIAGAPLLTDSLEVKLASYHQVNLERGVNVYHPVMGIEPLAKGRINPVFRYVLVPVACVEQDISRLRKELPKKKVDLAMPEIFQASAWQFMTKSANPMDATLLEEIKKFAVMFQEDRTDMQAMLEKENLTFQQWVKSQRSHQPDISFTAQRNTGGNPDVRKSNHSGSIKPKPTPTLTWEEVKGDLNDPTWEVVNPDPAAINMPVQDVLMRGIEMKPGYGGVAMPGSGYHQAREYDGVAAKDIPYVAPKMLRVTVSVFEFFQHCSARARWQVCKLGGFHFTFTPLSVEKDGPADCFHVVAVQRIVRLFRTPLEQEVYYNPRIRRENKSEPICYLVPPEWEDDILDLWKVGERIGRRGQVIPHNAVLPEDPFKT